MSQQALIDKIIKTAEAEAEQMTDEIIGRAAENEQLIIKKAEAEVFRIQKEADEKCEQIKRIASLTSGLESRKARLHARRKVLDEAFSSAYEMMLAMPDGNRLEYIKKLIIKYAPSKSITVRLSEKDLRLIDSAAVSDVKAALGEGAELSFEPDKNIDGGVYMCSQIADVDATLVSVFDELRDKYEAEADRILFAGQR